MVFGIKSYAQTDRQESMKRNDLPDPVDELRDIYDLFLEVMRNPSKANYIASMSNLKPTSRPLLDLRLLDKKNYIDYRIKYIIDEIVDIIHFK